MGALSDDPTVGQHDDPIHLLQAPQPMGNEDRCPVARDIEEVVAERICCLRVQVLGGLIEDKDLPIGQEQSREG